MLADGNRTGNERVIEWWRFDRMSTVYRPGSGRVAHPSPPWPSSTASGWTSACPSRHGNRKGGGEGNDSLAQRWWRSVPDDLSRRRPRTGWTLCLRVGDAECAALGRGPGPTRDRLPAAQQAHAGEEAFGDECFVLAF
jgi:hypothetical protein